MTDYEKGQTFLDLKATNYSGTKGKYFIALNDADDDDDPIIAFVMNTENRMDQFRVGCNKKFQKYILQPGDFSFIKNHTAIMLELPQLYTLAEMYDNNIKLLDKADDNLCRQIKNCIDFNYIPVKFAQIIKTCFK